MNIAYFTATLPTITLDGKPPFAPEAFVALCRDNLGTDDAAAVAALVNGDDSSHPFVAAWRERDTILRNAAARLRAQRRNTDPAPFRRPTTSADLRIEAAVETAFQAGDPLQRERQLDLLRWSIADELRGYDPLDAKNVLAYAIKLNLCATWAERTETDGSAASAALVDTPITL